MKKQLLAVLSASCFTFNTIAQVTDSVTLGSGYINQVWYSLQNDEQGNAANNNWDIAFDVVEITSSIHINSAAGVMLWNYPKGDKTAWSTVDTNGLGTWDARYNSEDSWAVGAMGRYSSSAFDLDWGQYDMTTHIVTGDSIYIIKLVNGDYKKLYIEKLTGGTFYFKFADLSGANEVNEQVNKSQFTDKNLGYYSISNQATVNREPNRDRWDVVFTQYTTFLPMKYNVTGVLHNREVFAVKVAGLANVSTYKTWQTQVFVPEINTIGYDWKKYDMSTSSYKVDDSVAYFVQSVPGDIWKLVFTGFTSPNGVITFYKEKLQTVSVSETESSKATMAIYPNPGAGGNVQLVYSVNGSSSAALYITDMMGKTVYAQQLDNGTGLHTYTIPATTLATGMYLVSVKTDSGNMQHKLVVN